LVIPLPVRLHQAQGIAHLGQRPVLGTELGNEPGGAADSRAQRYENDGSRLVQIDAPPAMRFWCVLRASVVSLAHLSQEKLLEAADTPRPRVT
jgi:hypothetical protein